MNKKRVLDAAIIFSCLITAVLCFQYVENTYIKKTLIIIMAICAVIFYILFLRDKRGYQEYGLTQDRSISEIKLLNDEDEEIATWDIFGKVSIVFGKQAKDNYVDIDLRNTIYAGTVDKEHAVMNYYNGDWYIEDLDSANGVKIEKSEDGGVYRVSSKEACKIERNDKIWIGLNRFQVQ